ncbi:uncharacterized protein [Montipora foliosa]|uniref:uncharacterized protein isoform X3 n=1 Tax=Montipora foliosa TaxID=591990 RepID=UPI0035F16212
MMRELLILLGLVGLHSTNLLAADTALKYSVCSFVKCPPGFLSVCPPEEPAGCKPCETGTFSRHKSRRKACRECSVCHDNEFQVHPCTPTSDVVCQKCGECSFPVGVVLQSCTRTSDTICGNCSSGSGCGIGDISEERSSPLKDGQRKYENWRPMSGNDDSAPRRNTTGKIQEVKSQAVIEPMPSTPSKSLYSVAAMGTIPTNSVDTSVHSANVATRSPTSLASGKLAGPSITSKFPTKFMPASNPYTRQRETVAYNAQKVSPARDGMWLAHNETRQNVSAAERFGKDVLPEPTEHDIEDDEINSSPDLAGYPDEIGSSPGLLRTPSVAKDVLDVEDSPHTVASRHDTVAPVCTLIFIATGIVITALSFLVCKVKKHRRTQRGSQGRCFISSLAESGIWRPRCPPPSRCCTSDSVSSIAVGDQADKMLTSAENVNENEDTAPSSAQETVMTYLPDDVISVLDIFPPQQGIASSFSQFVTHAEGIFNSNGGILTHPDSNVSIKIEHGTFPDGHPQPIFFNVIHDDTYVIRDIPETDERTLISPVIHCGPHDINPNKAIEIVVPHCLYVDEVKKGCITVYRCGEFPGSGPWNWEKIPSASEKNCNSNAWFSVKKDSIYIKTKTFSIWCVFACGGPKRKRATVYSSKPNPSSNLISLRFYIYSDNEDSKKRVERIEMERFTGTKVAAREKPFKLFNDNQDITVWLDPEALNKKGWELDVTPASQNYRYEMAYKNGFRSKDACEFSVKPIAANSTDVDDFSCGLHFQQENSQPHFIYVNPGIPLLPAQTALRFHKEGGENSRSESTEAVTSTALRFHKEGGENSSSDVKSEQLSSESTEAVTSTGFEIPENLRRRLNDPVTRQDCICICKHIVSHWKLVLRHLDMGEADIENIEADHRHAHEKSFQGLLAWTRSASNQIATMRKLCNALHAAGCTEALKKLSRKDADQRLPISENSSFEETSMSANNVV